jgi:hypothetical protein
MAARAVDGVVILEGAVEQAEHLALQMGLLAPIMLLGAVMVEAEDMVPPMTRTEAQAEFQAGEAVAVELTLVVTAVTAVRVERESSGFGHIR